jgi:DNA-binding NtrC family response regulator
VKRILAVDDERSAREYLRLLLEREGFEVVTAEDGVGALVVLEQGGVDLVISDLHMPEMDGGELLAHVVQRWPSLPVIMVTAASDVSEVVKHVQRGATNYIVKPAAPAVVTSAIEQALASRDVAPNDEGMLSEIVGTSKAMVEVRHRVTLAARSDVSVLITGQTGTGKELVARAIYSMSRSSRGAFVPHNCAVSPRDLFESQFFGHRKGAFTGADQDHKGLLREADDGLLFLDELETLDPQLQAKLLRVLDDGEVRPVGAEKMHRVSVRFVAATNREPEEMMAEGFLREDLYYRLRGFEIRLPKLAERRQDIPLLVNHFMPPGSPPPTVEAMELLHGAPWPGNVRELRNVVRSAEAVAGGMPIAAEHLPPGLGSRSERPEERGSERGEGYGVGLSLKEVERRAIFDAIERCGGNRTKAAQLLKIDRSTLRRKLLEFGVDRKR